jgi:voltage-dependent anion channel protein 2
MAFVPPLWSNFGKSLKDLLTKKYDYKHQVVVKNNISSDLNLESTVGLHEKDSGAFTGQVKAKYKNKDFGEVESEINTHPNKDGATLQAEVKATKFYDGLTLSLRGLDVPTVRAGAEYRQESVATSLFVEAGKESNAVEGTLAAGFDGFTVGGQAKYCSVHNLVDYNFGAEYSQSDYYLTLKTAKKADELLAGYWHNIPTSRNKLKTQVGAQVAWSLESGSKVFTVGTEHDIDETTSTKAKIDTAGVLAAVLEHRLTNPFLRLQLSANWRVQDRVAAPKQFGVGLTFGDY